LRAVQETLARGKTAIILVPEIALTLWIGRQCRAWFGARFEGVAVLHSALSDIERAREWWRVRNGEARVIVGTRSAIFAPVENLGLVIVDEEQESSYKQEETPRYHGRDVAIVRAKLEGALALLGSATPSMESFYHARGGKYELLTLAQRVAERSLPSVEILDLREEFRQTHHTSPISSRLHKALQESLARRPEVALVARLHVLVVRLFLDDFEEDCIRVVPAKVSLPPSVGDCKAKLALEKRATKLHERLPEREALWDWLVGLKRGDKLDLLAACVAVTLDATRNRGPKPGWCESAERYWTPSSCSSIWSWRRADSTVS
jgi:hypothetical protein